jgi:hypothetical protein
MLVGCESDKRQQKSILIVKRIQLNCVIHFPDSVLISA